MSHEQYLLSEAKYIPLVVLGCLGGSLSVLGSCGVLYMARQRFKTEFQSRLLFALSLSEAVFSACIFWTPFLVPSFLQIPGAMGNFATCTGIGFVYMGSMLTTACYNGGLSVYYFLVARRNWREEDFTMRLECLLHVVAIGIPLLIMSLAAATQFINPNGMYSQICGLIVWPWECKTGQDQVQCIRSSPEIVGICLLLLFVYHVFFTLLGVVCTILVWRTVKTTLRRSVVQNQLLDRQPTLATLRQVRIQASLYTLAYLNTFLWPTICMLYAATLTPSDVARQKDETGVYILQVLSWTLFPLQGVFNFFIYTRVKAREWRKIESQKSILWIYKQVLSDKELPRSGTSSKISSRNSKPNETTDRTIHNTQHRGSSLDMASAAPFHHTTATEKEQSMPEETFREPKVKIAPAEEAQVQKETP